MEVMTTLPSGILNDAFNKFGSQILQEVGKLWGLAHNLDQLKDVMDIIRDGLEAAEEQAIEDKQLSTWLIKVHDVAYDVDDLLHELDTKAEKYELKMHKNKWGSKVSLCFSKYNPVSRHKVANKIEGFKRRFEELAKTKESFHFEKNIGRGMTLKNDHRMTISNIDTEKVIGREEDKEKIRNEVTKIDGHQKVSIISIIGLGGLGKTTLAQLVYNDDVVQKHFKLRMWIYVSQNFDTRRLMRALFESVTGKTPDIEELSPLGEKIKEKLKGQRFLLVLDDFWDPDGNEWEKFSSLLSVSEAGSKIIVTTRSRDVARKLGSTFQHNVANLSDDDSWTLFKQRAFLSDSEELDLELVKIGKEILQKCGGVPLAVKALGSILSSKVGIKRWMLVRDSNVWRHTEGDKVMMSLRLSYYHLPSHLKQCFTICSVFPKGHRIDKEQLIDLWIAHDMISLADGVDRLDYIGNECFSSLVQMSFLQDVDEGFNGRVTCRMHDLVHDLAQSILGDEISHVVPEKTTDARKSYRYFTLIEPTGNVPPKRLFGKARALYVANGDLIFGKPQKNAKYLRSITMERVNTESMLIAMLQTKNLRYLHMSGLKCETLPEAISNIWSMQSLHITDSKHLREIPKSIGMLKKLRTLNLSNCVSLLCLPDSVCDCCMISTLDLTQCYSIEVPVSIGRNKKLIVLRLRTIKIERLPSSITTLENLECLDLEGCYDIRELPEDMGNLKKLEVLNLQGCYKLCGLPAGFGQLSGLEKLGLFIVGAGEKSARISELRNIDKISGKLTIRNIERVNDPGDASKACLKEKAKISDLTLEWGNGTSDLIDAKKAAAVLEGLEPPSRIERLSIWGYPSMRFARWMLRQHGDDESPCSSSNCLGVGVPVDCSRQFQCLTVLTLKDLPQLKRLQGLVELPCLQKLYLLQMPALESISGGPFPSLVNFELEEMPSLEELWTVTQFTLDDGEAGGRSMDHSHCRLGQVVQIQINSNSILCFPRLSDLRITSCPKLEAKPYLPSSLESLILKKNNKQLLLSPFRQGQGLLPPSFGRLKFLKLEGMTTAESRSGCGWELNLLQHLTALESLWVSYCDGLTELPQSMRSLTSLRSLFIVGCSALRLLPEWLGELRSLQKMTIVGCHSLCSLPLSIQVQHLAASRLEDLNGLTELPESMRSLTSLRSLCISRCPDLRVLPEWLGDLRFLQEMSIWDCDSLCSLPPSMQVQHLAGSLQVLSIIACGALHQLPEWMGEFRSLRRLYIRGSPCLSSLAQLSLPHLASSFQVLSIGDLDALHQLPEWLGELHSLRELELRGLPSLTCLPQSMRHLTSLERLRITRCKGITSLPAEIQGLTALRELTICHCPHLQRRCERGKGQDWHLISHIPLVRFL